MAYLPKVSTKTFIILPILDVLFNFSTHVFAAFDEEYSTWQKGEQMINRRKKQRFISLALPLL